MTADSDQLPGANGGDLKNGPYRTWLHFGESVRYDLDSRNVNITKIYIMGNSQTCSYDSLNDNHYPASITLRDTFTFSTIGIGFSLSVSGGGPGASISTSGGTTTLTITSTGTNYPCASASYGLTILPVGGVGNITGLVRMSQTEVRWGNSSNFVYSIGDSTNFPRY
jgi:hypothetical protein